MFYHVIVTLGKDWIDTKKADLPKYPDLQLSFSSQKQVQQDNRLNLDGPLVILPPPDKIPIYEEDEKPVNHPSTSIFGSPIRSLTAEENHIRKSHTNTRLYKERVELLEEWAGFEPIKIQLTNFGQTIAKGLRVHLIIPKDNSLTLKQNDEKFPKKPEKYFISGIVMPVHDLNFLEFARLQAKMRIEDKNDHYELEWDIEKLQAGVVTSSNKVLLIKLTHPVDIKCTIFCDELPEPSNAIITLRPPEREVTINIEDIVNDQQFDELYQKYLSVFKQ
ncbi:hypothetical protein SOASR032_09790 [Pragia fontium]|uniref:Uncharacterized protein n=1 Tax=Pragia fontium TaxID=82985 RepID=A0ABQ5LFU6_9GAMM|nr:hypothetical protein [Pragia fontium]GKX62410.1 hypothetical protein SOASR032_09790 [Pragia fontium]